MTVFIKTPVFEVKNKLVEFWKKTNDVDDVRVKLIMRFNVGIANKNHNPIALACHIIHIIICFLSKYRAATALERRRNPNMCNYQGPKLVWIGPKGHIREFSGHISVHFGFLIWKIPDLSLLWSPWHPYCHTCTLIVTQAPLLSHRHPYCHTGNLIVTLTPLLSYWRQQLL